MAVNQFVGRARDIGQLYRRPGW